MCLIFSTLSEENVIFLIFCLQVIFTDAEYTGDDEGSGSSTADPANIGIPPTDDDSDNKPTERFPIKCEYKLNGEPITQPPPPQDQEGINDIGGGENHITLLMDLYQSVLYTRTVQKFPAFAPRGDRMFFQVGVEGSDQMRVVPNHCWIAPLGSALPVNVHDLIVERYVCFLRFWPRLILQDQLLLDCMDMVLDH